MRTSLNMLVAVAWVGLDLDDPEADWPDYDPSTVVDAWAQLRTLLEPPWWHQFAACRGMGTELFFPGRGVDPRPAKAVCATCPVAEDCLTAQAVRSGHEDGGGIWGGTSERERRAMRSRRAA